MPSPHRLANSKMCQMQISLPDLRNRGSSAVPPGRLPTSTSSSPCPERAPPRPPLSCLSTSAPQPTQAAAPALTPNPCSPKRGAPRPRPPHVKHGKKGFIEPKMLAKKTSFKASPPTCMQHGQAEGTPVHLLGVCRHFHTASRGEGEERKEPSERVYVSCRSRGGRR